jgi:hypothetical protein
MFISITFITGFFDLGWPAVLFRLKVIPMVKIIRWLHHQLVFGLKRGRVEDEIDFSIVSDYFFFPFRISFPQTCLLLAEMLIMLFFFREQVRESVFKPVFFVFWICFLFGETVA